MILRASKFFGFCSADEVAEKEFFAKNFKAIVDADQLILSLDFMRGLDVKYIKENVNVFTFIEIEDVFLKNRLINVLDTFPQIKKVFLQFQEVKTSIKHLKLTHKGFVMKLI